MLKLLGVATFLGGQILLLVILLQASPTNPAAGQQQANTIHAAYVWVILPGLWLAMLAGLLLLLSIWKALLRMRWFVVKMLLVVLCLPMLHLYMRDRSVTLRTLVARQEDEGDAAAVLAVREQLCWGMGASIAFALTAAWLGRVKPRLGQDFGRTFANRAK